MKIRYLKIRSDKFYFGFVTFIALILGGCGGASAPPVTLSSIAISPAPIFVGATTTLHLTAKGTYSNKSTADLTTQVTWKSADPLTVASVDASGLVTAVGANGATTTITASLNGVVSPAVPVKVTNGGSVSAINLNVARFDHTATLLVNTGCLALANCKVLVTGGYGTATAISNGALDGSELYDPALKTWTVPPQAFLHTGRGDHTATLLTNPTCIAAGNCNVLVAGGVDSRGQDALYGELYDPIAETWTETGQLVQARSYHTATLLQDGKVLLVGGVNAISNVLSGVLSSAEIYDPKAHTWTATGSLATPRYSHTATLLSDGKVLVVGGFDGSNVLASAEIFDPAGVNATTGIKGTWTTLTGLNSTLATARFLHTATLLNTGKLTDKVLVAGGLNASGDVGSAELFDPVSGTWAPAGNLGVARFGHIATLMTGGLFSGQVMVLGGANASSANLSSAELYDPLLGTWSGTANLQTGRVVFTATLLSAGDQVLVAGGDGAAGALSSVEVHN